MKEAKTLAWVNMYGILGCLEDLCRFSVEAQALASGKPTAISFEVSNGPSMTLRFKDGACAVEPGAGPCNIRLPFSDCEKFNSMINGTYTPFPAKGFARLGFLTKNFIRLTKILQTYLRAKPEDLANSSFFHASTVTMFHLITRTVSQIGNNDTIGRFSASHIVDGTVVLSVGGNLQAAITAKDHRLTTSRVIPEKFHAIMEFADLKLARDVFEGKANTMGCVGAGLITMRGNLSMLDNINRILNRVAIYLA